MAVCFRIQNSFVFWNCNYCAKSTGLRLRQHILCQLLCMSENTPLRICNNVQSIYDLSSSTSPPGTEIGSRRDQTLSPSQQNKMADQGLAMPDQVFVGYSIHDLCWLL